MLGEKKTLLNERITFIDDDDLRELVSKYSKRGFKKVSGLSVDSSLQAGQQRAFDGKAIDHYALEFTLAPEGDLDGMEDPDYEYIAIFEQSMMRSFRGFPTWTVEQFELDNIASSPVTIGQGHLNGINVKMLLARKFDPARRAAEEKEKQALRDKYKADQAAKAAAAQKAHDAERAQWSEVKGFGIGGMKPGQQCKFSGNYTGYNLELDFPCSTHLFELELNQGIRGSMDLPAGNNEPGVTDVWTFNEMELNNMVGNKVYFAPGREYKVVSMKAKPKNLKESKSKTLSNADIIKEHNNNKKTHPIARNNWWYNA